MQYNLKQVDICLLCTNMCTMHGGQSLSDVMLEYLCFHILVGYSSVFRTGTDNAPSNSKTSGCEMGFIWQMVFNMDRTC